MIQDSSSPIADADLIEGLIKWQEANRPPAKLEIEYNRAAQLISLARKALAASPLIDAAKSWSELGFDNELLKTVMAYRVAELTQHIENFDKSVYVVHSSVNKIRESPDYQAVVATGQFAVPKLMEILSERPIPWLFALRDIVGKDGPIIPEEERGKIHLVVKRWKTWYDK